MSVGVGVGVDVDGCICVCMRGVCVSIGKVVSITEDSNTKCDSTYRPRCNFLHCLKGVFYPKKDKKTLMHPPPLALKNFEISKNIFHVTPLLQVTSSVTLPEPRERQ